MKPKCLVVQAGFEPPNINSSGGVENARLNHSATGYAVSTHLLCSTVGGCEKLNLYLTFHQKGGMVSGPSSLEMKPLLRLLGNVW